MINFLNAGVEHTDDPFTKRSIRLTNQIFFVCVVAGTLGELYTLYFKGFILIGFLQYAFAALLFLFLGYLNYIGKYQFARTLLLIEGNLSLVLIFWTIDKNALAHEIHYANFLIYLAVLKDYRAIAAWSILSIILFETGITLQGLGLIQPFITISGPDLLPFQLIFITVTSILIFLLAYFFKRGYDVAQEHLQRTNKDLQNNLKEKEVLLMEVHHRVKNNLQIIKSLLNMQKRRSNNPDHPEMTSAQNRIETMALVHEQLYSNKTFTEISAVKYIQDLVNNIAITFQSDGMDISVNVEDSEETIPFKMAMPVGLILNEIVTNSFKYAFNHQSKGDIHISFNKENGYYIFKISDNGSNASKLDDEPTNLGTTLINDMVEQLRARLDLDTRDGWKYQIMIPVD